MVGGKFDMRIAHGCIVSNRSMHLAGADCDVALAVKKLRWAATEGIAAHHQRRGAGGASRVK